MTERVFEMLYKYRLKVGAEGFVAGFLDDESARLAAAQLAFAGIPVSTADEDEFPISLDQAVDMFHNQGMPFHSHNNVALIEVNALLEESESGLELAWRPGDGFIATVACAGEAHRDVFLQTMGAYPIDWIVADKRVIREALNAKVYVIDGVDDRGKLPDGELHLGAFLVGEPNYI